MAWQAARLVPGAAAAVVDSYVALCTQRGCDRAGVSASQHGCCASQSAGRKAAATTCQTVLLYELARCRIAAAVI